MNTLLFHLNAFSFKSYLKEIKILLTLAIPMFLAQIAQVGTGFVDTVMAGAAGKEDLAAVALGSAFFFTIFVTFMGIMTALNPILAHEFGKNSQSNKNNTTNQHNLGRLTQQGLWFGAILGVFGMLILWALTPIFKAQLKVLPQTLDILSHYLIFVALAMPALMMSRALYALAISIGKPKTITYISWLVFFVNIPLNYAFIYGKFGLPRLGGAGCGVATMLVAYLGLFAMLVVVTKHKDFKPFAVFQRLYKPNLTDFRSFLTLGLPIGLSFFIEVSLFTFIMFLLAKLDGDTETFLAAQQIVMSLSSLIYMIPQSIGIASTARVGVNLGQNNFVKARYSTGVAISFGMMMACLTALLIVLARHQLASIYTNEREILALASSILLFAAAFQLVDAVQSITSAALRGYKLTKTPMLIHILAFWGCGLLPGAYLAFGGGMGIYGFWWALVVSLAIAAVLLTLYTAHHSQKVLKKAKIQV